MTQVAPNLATLIDDQVNITFEYNVLILDA